MLPLVAAGLAAATFLAPQAPQDLPIDLLKPPAGAPLRVEVGIFLVDLIAVLPLMMIVTMAWTVFWIDPAVIPTRSGTVVTTMLTLIAYRFALANLVPRLPYLTRLDWFMLGSTTLILATLMAMAASAYLKSQQRDELVELLDRRGRVAFAVAAVLVWTVPWVL